MSGEPRLSSAMTAFPHSVDASASLADAVELMRKHQVRHLPVTARGALTGVVTERDIKFRLGTDSTYPHDHDLKVRDAMIEDCYVVDVATPLHTVLRQMAARRLGSAIVTRRGKLAGVLTATDACRLLADYLEGAPIGESDEEDGGEWTAP